ncbi:MAG: murein L,D-transpeptidase [Alphaproteobacteria bacterium]|nr:murein L,D-transpeptidase [Alphaproteobacteria bacterium]
MLRLTSLTALIIAVLSLSACMSEPQYKRTKGKPYYSATLEHARKKNFSTIRTEMALKGLTLGSQLYIRAFKSEMEMEVWAQNPYTGTYKLFKTYPICNKSGVLGPKLKEGDLQTPEGFYDVTEDRMNPNSKYYLSFNIGFPNAYDKAHKRTGSLLMVHGSCVSQGCLAMTDQNIGEIYLLVEQNFKHGIESVPVHIFPFRMTHENMMLRNGSPWQPFWRDLKAGYDFFEEYNRPPVISIRNKKYVVNGARDI